MRKIFVLFFTAAVVSLDSFVAGFSLSLNKKSNSLLPAAVAAVTMILCLVTTVVGTVLKDYLDSYANVFGAVILTVLGVINLLKDEDTSTSLQTVTLAESVATGFAVGTDASVANLSLAIDGYGLAAPVVFAVTHYITVFAGQKLAQKTALKRANVFSALILFALAAIRILG
ncbi:MAG: manganese efflux pump MntP family protein [Corallococcus sp.]|nr:manganese efflux pump MntP family protein [Bacillota bacterium]MCM1533254.1 manganese efflux pump MntP family protein [Corallococcus sp.]